MSTVEAIGAGLGFLIVVAIVWKIIRHGVARSNGRFPEADDSWGPINHP